MNLSTKALVHDLAHAIHNHTWENAQWPGINASDHLAQDIAQDIAQNIVDADVKVNGPKANSAHIMINCLNFMHPVPGNGNLDHREAHDRFAKMIERLCNSRRSRDAQYIIFLALRCSARQSRALFHSMLMGISALEGSALEVLMARESHYVQYVWMMKHGFVDHDSVIPDDGRFNGPFGIEFMEQMIISHPREWFLDLYEDAIRTLPCAIVCRLLAVDTCRPHSFRDDKGNSHHVPGLDHSWEMDDTKHFQGHGNWSPLSLALLIQRNSERRGQAPRLGCIERFANRAPRYPQHHVLTLAIGYLRQMRDSKLDSRKIAGILAGNPEWIKPGSNFAKRTKEWNRRLPLVVGEAIGSRRLSEMIVSWL